MSTIPFLKSKPEEAVLILDMLIVSGYLLLEELEKEFFDPNRRGHTQDFYQNCDKKIDEWLKGCLKRMGEIFVSPRQLFDFKYVEVTSQRRPYIDKDYDEKIKTLLARINVLGDQTDFIYQHYTVKMSIQSLRDVIIQQGDNPKVEVKNG